MLNQEIFNNLIEKITRLNKEIGVSFPNIADGKEYNNDANSFWTKDFGRNVVGMYISIITMRH